MQVATLGALHGGKPYCFAREAIWRHVHSMAIPFRRRVISSVGRAYSRDPLERVAWIGGVNPDRTRWTLSQPAAIAMIENGTDEFFYEAGDERVRVVVLKHDGEKYLQSEREQTHPDDLLNVAARVLVPEAVAVPARVRRH